jgi:hypothetical protein
VAVAIPVSVMSRVALSDITSLAQSRPAIAMNRSFLTGVRAMNALRWANG